MPHDRSRLPIQTDGSTVISSPSMTICPLHEPSWAKRCASSVTRLPDRSDVRLFLHDVEQAFPGEIDGDALGLVEHDPQLVQRLDDLDAVAVDVLVEPVLVDGVGKVHRGLRSSPRRTSTKASLTPRLG